MFWKSQDFFTVILGATHKLAKPRKAGITLKCLISFEKYTEIF